MKRNIDTLLLDEAVDKGLIPKWAAERSKHWMRTTLAGMDDPAYKALFPTGEPMPKPTEGDSK